MIQKFPYKQVSMQKTASYFILKHLNDEHPFYKGAPRFELGTFRSAVECSTTELYPHKCLYEFTFDILDYKVLILRKKPYLLIFVSHRMRKQRIIWLIIEFLLNRKPRQIFQLFEWRNCVFLNNTSWTALTQISFHKLMRISFKLSKVRLIRRNIFSELIFKFNKHNNETI